MIFFSSNSYSVNEGATVSVCVDLVLNIGYSLGCNLTVVLVTVNEDRAGELRTTHIHGCLCVVML